MKLRWEWVFSHEYSGILTSALSSFVSLLQRDQHTVQPNSGSLEAVAGTFILVLPSMLQSPHTDNGFARSWCLNVVRVFWMWQGDCFLCHWRNISKFFVLLMWQKFLVYLIVQMRFVSCGSVLVKKNEWNECPELTTDLKQCSWGLTLPPWNPLIHFQDKMSRCYPNGRNKTMILCHKYPESPKSETWMGANNRHVSCCVFGLVSFQTWKSQVTFKQPLEQNQTRPHFFQVCFQRENFLVLCSKASAHPDCVRTLLPRTRIYHRTSGTPQPKRRQHLPPTNAQSSQCNVQRMKLVLHSGWSSTGTRSPAQRTASFRLRRGTFRLTIARSQPAGNTGEPECGSQREWIGRDAAPRDARRMRSGHTVDRECLDRRGTSVVWGGCEWDEMGSWRECLVFNSDLCVESAGCAWQGMTRSGSDPTLDLQNGLELRRNNWLTLMEMHWRAPHTDPRA